MRALVVFTDSGNHPLAFLLKPKFRHVFVCVLIERDGVGYWISIDPYNGIPEINVLCGSDTDLQALIRECGHVVVQVERAATELPWWPWALASCVGVVKCVLGIRAPFVITPYQLYKRLSPWC